MESCDKEYPRVNSIAAIDGSCLRRDAFTRYGHQGVLEIRVGWQEIVRLAETVLHSDKPKCLEHYYLAMIYVSRKNVDCKCGIP